MIPIHALKTNLHSKKMLPSVDHCEPNTSHILLVSDGLQDGLVSFLDPYSDETCNFFLPKLKIAMILVQL